MRLRVECLLPDGEKQVCEALVDIEAQVNLCRLGLFPSHMVEPSPNPMRLRVANGGVREGRNTKLLGLKLSWGTPGSSRR